MIWITTLCLLLVAAWFLFNGLNERNWVKAHGHESGDDGEGLLYKLGANRDDEDLIYKVSKKPGVVEKLAADKPVDVSGTGDTFFDQVAARVGRTNDRFEDRVAEKVKEVSANPGQISGEPASSSETAGQAAGNMGATARNLKDSLASRAQNMAAGYREKARSATANGDQDLMTRVSNRINSTVNAIAPGSRKDD